MATKLAVKVIPKASRDEVVGWLNGVLKLRVAAPPERGKANAAVVKLLARSLGIARERVHLVSGHTASHKLLMIEGLSEPEILRKLGGEPGPHS